MALLPGRSLRDPNGNELHSPLAECFSIHNAGALRVATGRTWNSDTYKDHDFKLIAVTAKGAGGTGKTTCAWGIAHHLALAGANVLLLNTDGQPSVEERALGNLVNTVYNSDYDSFVVANELEDQTLLMGLQGVTRFAPPAHNQPPENIFPDVVGIDVTKLATEGQAGEGGVGRLFVMRSDENISEWETELGSSIRAFRGQPNPPEAYARVPGALYHLAKMMAYMLDAEWVIVDTGPGSGPLFMNVVMTSHGFIVPCGIDQKAKSMMQSLASKLVFWTSDHLESHVRIRMDVNGAGRDSRYRNKFPTPEHTPKFLGIVYSRLGLRGRQFPYNQYAAMVDANSMLQNVLMPTLRQRGMLLPDPVYHAAAVAMPAEFDDFNEAQAAAKIRVPNPVPGVTGIWVEFGQLQYMSDRESVPVFFLEPQPWHMRVPREDHLNIYINAVQQGQEPPFSIWAPQVYRACNVKERIRMGAKVEHLGGILNNIITVLQSDLNLAAPPVQPAAADAPPAADDDEMMA